MNTIKYILLGLGITLCLGLSLAISDDASGAVLFSNEVPVNTTVDVELTPTCYIDLDSEEDNLMDVYFCWWTGIAWGYTQTETGVGDGTYDYVMAYASSYATTYYWFVQVYDGSSWYDSGDSSNHLNNYWFTTEDAPEPPTQSSPSPANQSINQITQPWCNITVNDPDGNSMIVRWYENSTGTWVLRQTNATAPNGTYWWRYVQAVLEGHTYYWRVDVLDETYNVSKIYHFTTGVTQAPVISNPTPVNYTMDRSIQSWCGVTVTQAKGIVMTVEFYRWTGAWTLDQTNASVYNGTFYWHYTESSEYFKTYQWRVRVVCFNQTVNAFYVFETQSNNLETYYKNLLYNDYNASNFNYGSTHAAYCNITGARWVFWAGKDANGHTNLYGTYSTNNWTSWTNVSVFDSASTVMWINVRDAVRTSNDSVVVLFFTIDGSATNVTLGIHYYGDPAGTWSFKSAYSESPKMYWPRMAINDTDAICISTFDLAVQIDMTFYYFATDTWKNPSDPTYGRFRYWGAADTSFDIMVKANASGKFWFMYKYSTGIRTRDVLNATSTVSKAGITNLEDFVILPNDKLAFLALVTNQLYWYYETTPGTFVAAQIGDASGDPAVMTSRCSITSGNNVTIFWRDEKDGNLKKTGPILYNSSAATWGANRTNISAYFNVSKPFWPGDGYVSLWPTNSVPDAGYMFPVYDEHNAPYYDVTIFGLYSDILNTPPGLSDPYPANGSVGEPNSPWCRITITDINGDLMTLKWYENTTGPWVLRQTNSSAPNGSYFWRYMLATSKGTYYWRVTVSDGAATTEAIFHFDVMNTPPDITFVYPPNNAHYIPTSPQCSLTISDLDGDTMRIRWYENTTGFWLIDQTDTGLSNGTYTWNYTQASVVDSTYYWYFIVDDGDKSSGGAIYKFYTDLEDGGDPPLLL